MFDEPSEPQFEQAFDPAVRAKEKSDEFRMHAELCAVFEACRKFDARLQTDFDSKLTRTFQRTMGKLEKARSPEHPVLPPKCEADATELLNFPAAHDLRTSDYHINRRPGEVMIVRWLAGVQVGTFYERFQAHFDVAMNQFREEERQQHGWKKDAQTTKYLEALDALEIRMSDRYLRKEIRTHKLSVLSTQAADELDIQHLCDYVMGVEAAQVVGRTSAPPEDGATEQDRAWFFKLFSLRGIVEGEERMCFFAYLQKVDDTFDE